MFIPNECMHNRISIRFIEHMVANNKPFYCKDLSNEVYRFMYRGDWVNVIDFYDNGPCGILNKLSEILTGRFFLSSSVANHKFGGHNKKDMLKVPHRWQKNGYYTKGLDSFMYLESEEISIFGENVSPIIISGLITPVTKIRTNNVTFDVDFIKTYIGMKGIYAFHSINLRQRWPNQGQALTIINAIESMVAHSLFPMAMWAKGRDWLTTRGWVALGRDDNETVPYVPEKIYNKIEHA